MDIEKATSSQPALDTFNGRMQYLVRRFFTSNLAACYHFHISSPTQLKNYLQLRCYPSWQVLTGILEYGISVEWLMTGHGSLFANNEAGSRLQLQMQLQGHEPAKVALPTQKLDNEPFNMPPAPAGSLFNPEAPSHQQTQAAAV
ncbi:MAG TPA: hypothetical protein VK147_03740 [Candidatus Didemnitutus sp.]|nr:hypothetical protein [Candidatus Didemnitutus sp.]